MKKHLFLYTALCAIASGLGLNSQAAAAELPYKSDLGANYRLVEDWSQEAAERKGSLWEYDRDSNFSTPGTKGGMRYCFNSDLAADVAMISPEFTLEEGKTYTVGVWMRTSNSGRDAEAFKILMAGSNTLSGLKAGTVLIERNDYVHNSDFEQLTATFQADRSGSTWFGIYCCSDVYQGTLCATGFTLVEGDGSDDPFNPGPVQPKEPKQLPYTADFSSEGAFRADWSSLAGPDAEMTGSWDFNSYSKYPEFCAYEMREDNYLVSPPLLLEQADQYLITTEITAIGDYDIVLGTDPNDPASFTRVLLSAREVTYFNEPIELPFTISADQTGTYYVAMHVCAASGSLMGYRMHNFKIKQDLPFPALITDLKAQADKNDGLSVTLSWTNPALNSLGTTLQELTSIDILRDGELIATVDEGVAPGAKMAWTDAVPAEGVYTYTALARNSAGTLDADPIAASSGFVGHPVAQMPYDINIDTAPAADTRIFTSYDADGDGKGWNLVTSYGSTLMVSTVPANGEFPADNYLATPYIPLEAGYYKLTYTVSAYDNSFEVGYATDRHNLAETFTSLSSVEYFAERGMNTLEVVMSIPQAGEYCMVIRHTGYASYIYPSVSLSALSLRPQALLPDVAENLAVKVIPENTADSYTARFTWTNPSTDNAGMPLQSLKMIELQREGTTIAYITDQLTPGADCSYDLQVRPSDPQGEQTFTLVVSNDNGCSEAAAPQCMGYFGTGRQMPYNGNFKEWTMLDFNNQWFEWTVNGRADISFTQDAGQTDDFAMSPYLQFENGKYYEVTVLSLASNSIEPVKWNLALGASSLRHDLIDIAEATTEDYESNQTHKFLLHATDGTAVLADEVETPEAIEIPAGVKMLGIHLDAPCTFNVKGFKVEETIPAGIAQITADPAAEISFADGQLHFPTDAKTFTVTDLQGRILLAGACDSAKPVDLSGIASGILLVTVADNSGNLTTIKLRK